MGVGESLSSAGKTQLPTATKASEMEATPLPSTPKDKLDVQSPDCTPRPPYQLSVKLLNSPTLPSHAKNVPC